MATPRQEEIYSMWLALDDDDASTERLFQMVADATGADHGEIADALFVVGTEKGVINAS